MKALRYGSSGNDVYILQLALRRSGRFPFGLDGVYGTRTLNAVRRFQTAEGLTPDGVAGSETNAALEPYLLGSLRVTLRAGDTFYRLARRYGTSAGSIAAANPGMDAAALPVGAEITVPLGFDAVPTEIPYSSALTGYAVQGLMLRYPFIAAEEAGRSVLGSPLTVLSIGSGGKEVFFNAAHHANEWITTPLVLGFLEELAKAYVSGGSVGGVAAAELLSSVRLYVMPLVDPDGADLVTGAISPDMPAYADALAIAEGYPDIPFPSGWKANIAGTDLNLNYPAEWQRAREIKFGLGFTGPAPRDYVGEAPLSAPEAAAVHAFSEAHGFALAVAYHTQGGEIYWSFGDIEPPRGREIGEALAEASGYTLAEAPYASGFAGYKDWFILNYGRPAFTVEAGRGTNPLPLSELDALKKANYPLMAKAMELA